MPGKYLLYILFFLFLLFAAHPVFGQQQSKPDASSNSNQNLQPSVEPLQNDNSAQNDNSEDQASSSDGKTIEMSDIHDVRPPVPGMLDLGFLKYIFLSLAAALCLILLFLIWKYRSRRVKTAIAKALSPEEQAFTILDGLKEVEGWEAKEFYFKLSAALRGYIEGKFNFAALEMTIEEFLPKVNNIDIDQDAKKNIRDLCRFMEPVKFAGLPASEDRMVADLGFVYNFVKKTSVQIRQSDDLSDDLPDDLQDKNL
ncbi:hypothetical protein QUF76_12185 [Desulfobacterales bacterium HSG16]|nr:hypothetical protein [Desulfobacterales bacterium HSG16]